MNVCQFKYDLLFSVSFFIFCQFEHILFNFVSFSFELFLYNYCFFLNYCVDQLQNYNLRQNHVIIVLKVLNKIIWCTGYALQNSKQIVLNCLWFGSGGFHLVFMA